MILLLDNTVLSNFALVGQLELLKVALGSLAATTSQVKGEFLEGVVRGRLPETNLEWLKIIELEHDEILLFNDLLVHINVGEASCLAIAAKRKGRILTDDRDARRLAAQLKVPISGTLGILLRLVHMNASTLDEVNEILAQMINKGYRSPVQNLEDL